MISQCPNCKTRFTVSEEKLNIAGGNVRCGACMQVFSASDYQIQVTDSKKKSADNLTAHSTADHEATREWLNDLLPESGVNTSSIKAPTNEPDKKTLVSLIASKTDSLQSVSLQNETIEKDARIEPSVNSMVGFETPPVIEAPPIEMTISDKPSFKNRLLGVIGASLCLALLLTLGLHWLLAHPDQFKDHPRWQDAYRLACELRTCKQSLSVNDYQTQSLSITSHPEQPNTLLLEAVIINSTQRQLPFPTIEVQFSDRAEQPLTSFSSSATEYLNGELQNAEYFPPTTPVRISVKIPDPGPAAVNYDVKLK